MAKSDRPVARLRRLKLAEVSLVDRPANQHATVTLVKRDFSGERREEMAEEGTALPDGSYPIANKSDLKNAIQAFGRAKNQAQVKRHIIKRARALGATDLLPEDWGVSKAQGNSGDDEEEERRRRRRRRGEEEEAQIGIPPGTPGGNLGNANRFRFKAADLPDTIVKCYMAGMSNEEGAKPFAETMRRAVAGQQQQHVMEVISPLIWALQESLDSIARDANLDTAGKQSMMRTSAEQFLGAVTDKWPEAEENMEKAFTEGVDDMPQDTKAELQAQIDTLTAKLEAMTKAEPNKAKTAELETQVADLTAKLEAADKAQKAAEAERDAALAKAKMTDEEREYMESMKDEKARKDFMALSSDERKKTMKKAAETDETIEVAGRTIRKSVVGDDQFEVLKAQQAQLDEQKAQIAKQNADLAQERDARELAELEKRAEAEFPHLPGDTATRAKVLKAVAAIPDESVRKAITEIFTAGEKLAKTAFDKMGHSGGGNSAVNGDPTAFSKRVDEIAARDKISKTEAMTKARREYPEEFQAHQEHRPN